MLVYVIYCSRSCEVNVLPELEKGVIKKQLVDILGKHRLPHAPSCTQGTTPLCVTFTVTVQFNVSGPCKEPLPFLRRLLQYACPFTNMATLLVTNLVFRLVVESRQYA